MSDGDLGEEITRRDVGVDWNRPRAYSWDVTSHPMDLPQAPGEALDWRALIEAAFHPERGGWDTPVGRLFDAILKELDMLRLVAHWQGAGLSKQGEDTFAVYSGMFEMLTKTLERVTDLEMQVEVLKVARDAARDAALDPARVAHH